MTDIAIFVRHSADCPHRDDEKFRKCKCRKHLRWSSNGKQFKRPAKTRVWAEAERTARELEANLSGVPLPASQMSPLTFPISAAIDNFILSKKTQGLHEHVVNKYRRELNRFQNFLGAKGKFTVAEITLDELIAFRAEWEQYYHSATTRQKVQERLRGFLRYCYEAGHLDRVPAMSAIKAKPSVTMPLTEKEYSDLLAAIPEKFKDDRKAARIHALVRLMRYSGLAIRDAVTLERNEIQFDEKKKLHRIVTARQKTGTHVSVPLPKDVAKELLEVLNGNPRFVFWTGNGQEETAVKDWHHDLRELFDAAGMPKGHPHQLRDTFAVDLLARGVPLQDVSKLLGHESIKTTERFYAKWETTRQDRLDSLVTKARAKKS